MIKFRPKNDRRSDDLAEELSLLLTSLSMEFFIEDSIASLKIIQKFINRSGKQLELAYKLPLPDDSVVEGFKVILDDGTVLKAEVQNLDQALIKYQDSISQGDTPLLSKVKSNKLSFLIGNLGSEDGLTIEYSLCFPLVPEENHWKLSIPVGLIPAEIEPSLAFSLKLLIKSRFPITYDSSNAELSVLQSPDFLELSASMSDHSNLSSSFWFKFSSSPSNPSIVLQKVDSCYFGALTFIPFPSEGVELSEIEGTGEYIFLLDRSGSMQGKPIQLAVQSAIIFLQSLPTDSYFNIVSFGSTFDFMFKTSAKLSNVTLTKALSKLEKFEADLISTDIYSPLKKVLEEPLIKNYPRCIFLLTDGEVDNRRAVIHLLRKNQGNFVVYGLGIGDSVDKSLIRKAAKVGKGLAYFCNHPDKISTIVIRALKASIIPGRGSWNFNWPSSGEAYPSIQKIGTIRYGQRFLQYVRLDSLLDKSFEISYFDNYTRETHNIEISNFHVIPGNCLAKLWAAEKINDLMNDAEINKAEIVSLSLFFEVPCKFTRFVCVKPNSQPVMGEIITVKIKEKKQPVPRRRGPSRCKVSSAYLLPDPKWFRENQVRKRSRSRSPRSESDQIKLKFYKAIIKEITFEGFWRYNDFIKIFPSLAQVPHEILICDDRENAICTVFVIRFLQKRCQENQEEWTLIERKALKWLKTKNVELNSISQSFDEYLPS